MVESIAANSTTSAAPNETSTAPITEEESKDEQQEQ